MEKLIVTSTSESLLPVLTDKEKTEIRAYYRVSEKYQQEMSEKAMAELKAHPVFGKLIDAIPEDIAEANRKLSQDLQKDAVENDNWEPYINYQMEQGITYAKMGLEFKSWYEVVSLARKYLMPYLQKEYDNKDELTGAINGMNVFFDIAMGIIGAAYMKERNDIIGKEQKKIKKLNDELEIKVIERTAQLETVNKELEAFSYSVSHDLRAPLRAISGYAEMLNEDYGKQLDQNGIRTINNITYYANNMGRLIDELLAFSRLGKKELQKTTFSMDDLTEGVLISIDKSINHRARIKTDKLPNVSADYGLIYQVMFNLIANAVKYSSKKENPVVEISSAEKNNEYVFLVQDNGAGFDMRYSDKLFGVFQRLHSPEEFEGSGVGLAIVHRLVTKHNGKIWAEGKVNEGAKFYFSLPKNTNA